METNAPSNTLNTRVQPSIRSFFQPRQPSYTAPPGAATAKSDSSILPASTSRPLPQFTPKPTRSPSTLPLQASITFVREDHVQPLRRINSLLLPISYPDSFYHKAASPDAPISFSRVASWTDPSTSETKVIGGIVCRLDPALSPDSTPQSPKYLDGSYDIYIQSLALLSPYRGKGLAASILQEIIDSATVQQELKIVSLYAHVWTENEDALKWYSARGFKKETPVLHGYYKRLKPDTAWILRRRFTPTDHLSQSDVPSPMVQANSTLPPVSNQTNPIPSSSTQSPVVRPIQPPSARSFQDRGPDREWNDLPEDVLGNTLLKAPSHLASREGSAASSRSSSRSGIEGKKKKRVYPTAAFGS